MKIKFLGTRGDIKERMRRHQKCSSFLIESKGKRLQIEFGPCYGVKDIASMNPDAILVSHAHPTHSEGIINLKTNTPVYMSQDTFNVLVKRKLAGGIHIKIYKRAFNVGPFHITPFGVMHSVRTPSNGFVITVEGRKIVYAGDMAYLPKSVLKGAWLYIGDGSYLAGKGNLKRLKNALIGHAPIKFQLQWCKDAGVKIAIFTHFGKWIKEQNLKTVFKNLSKEFNMSVHAAHDKRTFESKETALGKHPHEKKKKKTEKPRKCKMCSKPAIIEVPQEEEWYCGPCFMSYLASRYPLSVANYKWIEEKKTGTVKCVILDTGETNTCGLGIQIPQDWNCLLSKEVNGVKYMYVGQTPHTDVELPLGRIAMIKYEQLDYYTDPETQMKQVVLRIPTVMNLLEEQAIPCTAAEVIVGAKKRGILHMQEAHLSYLEEQAKKAEMDIKLT